MRKIIGIFFFDVIRKRVDIKTRYSNYQTPFKAEFLSIIICFGVTTMVSSYDTFAASNIVAGTTEQIYNISAGSLKNALDQFTKQTGVSLSYDATELEGITTRGLNGKFSVKRGLDRLLAESGLQAVPQADGYIVRKDQAPKPETKSTKKPTILPMVQVSADKESRYLAPRSTTAMKTNTLLRDTPQSITVITQKQLQDQAPLSMTEAMRYVPGVGVSTGEGNRDALVFRGQRSTGDFYIDGMRDDVQYFRDFYNIDRIEVLKGPNGMIFGRGGSGGVINRVRKEANWAPIHEIKFSAGTYDHKRVSVDAGHVINDKVAVRLNGLYEDSENFRDGFELQRYGVTPTITIKPTKDTRVVFHAELFKDDRIADRGIPSFMGSPFKITKRSTFFGGPATFSPTDTSKKSLSLLIDHKFNNNVTIRNRTHYATFDKFYQNIFAGSSVNTAGMVTLGAYNDETDRTNFFNQTDLLLTFDTWRFNHKVVTGVEVGRQVTDQLRLRGHFSGVSTTQIVSASFPNTASSVIFFNRGLQDSNNHVSNSLVSVFIQDQIEILPQLHAVLGVRYNRFEVDFKRKDFLQPELKSRDDLIDPRFGLIFKPIEQVSIYGSYSLSHQPRAGDQLKSITVTNATLEPEKFTNIEAGIKWDILPNLAATTAFYQLDRDNVILPTGIAGVSFLGKGTRVRGVEAGINGQITDAWSIIGAYTYQEGTLDTTGATLGEVPRNMYSIWNRYDFTPWFGAAFGVIGRSNMFTTTTNRVTLPAFVRVDAALYGRINKYLRAQVNIENLFDVNYIAAAHNDNNIAPGAPITARASITATF
jgi:catecholate siderophore receptor